jgi:hypothetical protein
MIQPSEEAYVVFRIASESTLGDAVRQFTGQDGLTVVEQRRAEVNGRTARRVLAEGQTQKEQTLRLLSYFIEYDDQVYQFQGLTTADRYGTYRTTFEETMTRFDDLRDPDKLNVQPKRLSIEPAPRTAPFRTFVDESALPDGISDVDLAIINQVELNTSVGQGRPLKLSE